jgi:cyclophilin family peptidyl-prolyl cis-trans isomerase
MLLASPAAAQAPDLRRPGTERVHVHTILGDLVLVLYPQAAPRTVEQFLRLCKAGVYNTTAFTRVEPGFVAQVSTANDRLVPLTQAQREVIRRIPAEFNSLSHQRGDLSMARRDNDPDSAETSFSVILGPAPHLDGKYTLFGHVESGMEVFEQMVKVPRDRNRPRERITVQWAMVIPNLEALSRRPVERAHPSPGLAAQAAMQARLKAKAEDDLSVLGGGLALTFLLGLTSFFLQGRVRPSVHGSLNLAMMLVVSVLLLALLLRSGQRHSALGILLYVGLVGVFKAMGSFERASE